MISLIIRPQTTKPPWQRYNIQSKSILVPCYKVFIPANEICIIQCKHSHQMEPSRRKFKTKLSQSNSRQVKVLTHYGKPQTQPQLLLFAAHMDCKKHLDLSPPSTQKGFLSYTLQPFQKTSQIHHTATFHPK